MTGLTEVQGVLDAAIAFFAVLAGVMAAHSGRRAAEVLVAGGSPEEIGAAINLGFAQGFLSGSLPAILALIIEVSTPAG